MDGSVDADVWQLRLYVAGATPASRRAQQNLEALCSAHLPGRYRIEVHDVLAYPELADEENLVALPAVVRRHPRPRRKVVGDLSLSSRVVAGLGLPPRSQG